MHRRIDFYARQPPRVPEIVVERGPKDQRVPAYRSIKMLPVSSSGNDNRVARGEPDVPRRDRERHFDGTNLAPDQVRGLLFGRGEPGLILPWGSPSSSIYLRFINTKTRQPVGFQSTDIAD